MRAYKELTLQQLRSFHAVYSLGGYAAAGRELMLTAPAVWEQIQALEKYYEATLLIRDGNGMTPTPEGKRLIELTLPVLAALESTRSVFRQEQGLWPDRMKLGSNLRVLASEITGGLKAFQTNYPEIGLEVAFLRDEPLMQSVLDGTTDVAFTLEPGPRGLPTGLIYESCGEAEYLVVAPKGHPISRLKRFTLNDLVNYPLVLGDNETYSRQRVQEVFHRHHLTADMKIAIETNSDEYSTQCVRSGLGVGITIGTPTASLYKGLYVRPLGHWFGFVKLGFLRKAGAHEAVAQRAMIDHIRQAISTRTG
jgi:DNA-binding transcriptional LysR family regulator